MGISGKLSQVVTQLQSGAKLTAFGLLAFCVKLIAAGFVGLTLAIAGQELIQFGNFSFVLMFVVSTGLILRLLWRLSLVGVLVFILISVLLGLLFRMYLLMAP